MNPSDPACYRSDAALVRFGISPLRRREIIRQALEDGDWFTAAAHLHRAHQLREHRMVAGIRSWSAYVETIPLSRMHDWRLRLIAATDQTLMGYNFRAAYRLALDARAAVTEPTSTAPESAPPATS